MKKTNHQDKFIELREKYPTFRYKNFIFDYNKTKSQIELEFEFECAEHIFKPKLSFPVSGLFEVENLSPDDLAILVFNIGMVELVSYWKAFASPVVIIETGHLEDRQIDFWKKLYFNGLGEYFYLNSIETNIDEFMTIVSCGKKFEKPKFKLDNEAVIVPIGGGKDSVVTLELLRNNCFEVIPMIINPRGATTNCMEAAQIKKDHYLTINRTIDPHLLELNSKGYLNGHTPFSAMLAFVTLFVSALTGSRHIALSNEFSANESTVMGENINHQYSKSLEYENDFREYVLDNISNRMNYFSFLRPLSELQIAQQFSQLTQYHDVFRSCNAGSKTDIWCCNCPKCLFAYIILSPFMEPSKLERIFGENLLNKESMKHYLDELTGVAKVKPFECVGTIEEVNAALFLLSQRYPQSKEFALMSYWLEENEFEEYHEYRIEKSLIKIEKEHNLTSEFLDILSNPYIMFKKAEIARELIDRNIVIFGYGREGESTYHFLRELFPTKKFGIQDSNTTLRDIPEIMYDLLDGLLECHVGDDSKYSQNELYKYDLVIKTPGVSIKKMVRPYDEKLISSQTKLFLKHFGHQCIGITGTKGKSTTSTLVYEMLKAKYDNVLLAGNIGVPMFDLIDKITPETIIVLELSAHQLQYINHSPDISVVLNLYEEHLDHFANYEEYQSAKMNLLKNLDKYKGFFIYNEEDRLINKWIKDINPEANLIPLNIRNYSFDQPKYLKGEHNKFNIMVAYEVARLCSLNSPEGLKKVLEFKGLEHRLEFVAEINGVEYYNDSISTIPQSALAAIKSLDNVETLILGGMDRGIDYNPLLELLDVKSIKNIAYVGEAGKRIKSILEKEKNYNINSITTDSYQEIVSWCKANTGKGKKCLLSPAAPSYDNFKNFEERGKHFKNLVNKRE